MLCPAQQQHMQREYMPVMRTATHTTLEFSDENSFCDMDSDAGF